MYPRSRVQMFSVQQLLHFWVQDVISFATNNNDSFTILYISLPHQTTNPKQVAVNSSLQAAKILSQICLMKNFRKFSYCSLNLSANA